MIIPITTPALLFPAIAILMLGYVNRYLGTANVIRTFKKDYDSGYTHAQIIDQLTVLKKRIELSRYMLSISIMALVFACAAMFLIFMEWNTYGAVFFGLSLLGMITSMLFSLYETSLSNKSLLVEIHDIFERETKAQR